MNRSDITSVVLAGGAGRRLGYRNKGLIEFEGQRLITQVLARIQPQVGRVLVVANADVDTYRQLGLDVIEDTDFRGEGPLAGILAAARITQSPWLVVVPCDLPFLPTDLVARLADSLGDLNASIAHDGEREQFLVALLRTELAFSIEPYLKSSRRSVHGWLALQAYATADFSDQPDSFRNINTPQDLLSL